MPKSKSTEPSRPDTRLTPRGKGLSYVAAALLVPAVVVAANKIAGGESDKNQVGAVKQARQISGNVIVLKSGAVYRVTPTDYGRAHNEAGKVPQGKELVIDKPLISSTPGTNTLNEPGWIGFSKPGTNSGINSLESRAKVTVWADLNKLESEGYAQAYPDVQPVGGTIRAHVADQGGIVLDQSVDREIKFLNSETNSSGKIVEFNPINVTDPTATTSLLEPAGTFKQAENG